MFLNAFLFHVLYSYFMLFVWIFFRDIYLPYNIMNELSIFFKYLYRIIKHAF